MPCTKDNLPKLLIAIREFIKRIRCILACCDSQINIIQSELDGSTKEERQGRRRKEDSNPKKS